MDILSTTEHGGGEVFKKLDFYYSEKKNHYSEICILMHVDFLIITKNPGGLAAMVQVVSQTTMQILEMCVDYTISK